MSQRLRAAAWYLPCIWLCASFVAAAPPDNLQYVNPLIGTANGGNTFPGATLPYGMAKAVADVDGDDDTDGFALPLPGSPYFNVTGFSSMHDNGSGGQPSLGQFPLFPYSSCPGDDLDNCQFMKDARKVQPVPDSIVSRPGYFGISLQNGIRAEMTTSNHSALYRFKMPSSTPDGSPLSPMMLLDLTDLADSRQNASISVDEKTGRILANGTFLPSFGVGYFRSYVCADFKGAGIRDTGVYVNARAGTQPKQLFVERGYSLFYIQAGGFVRFNASSTILARVGVSLISSEQACRNAERELPDWNFNKTTSTATDAWRKKLAPISIDAGGADVSLLQTFFSGLYRSMISPQDYTGENPLWSSSEPYFDSFYCIWDSFRAQHPLLTVVDPQQQSRILRALLDIYKRGTGWLPDCRMSLDKGYTQGGSNADVLMADGFVKNLTGVDWNLAYEAVVKDAEVEPFDWGVEGRGGLQSWHTLNYIPYLDYDYLGFGPPFHSISRTVEYANNDFSAATLAKGLGKQGDYEKYLQRSGNWRYLYKSDQRSQINGTDTGFQGFLQPRYMNGTFGYMAPSDCAPLDSFCSLTSNAREVFEDSIWTYTFYAPSDQATLIQYLGGPATFVKRLDYLHNYPDLTDIGNEPAFLTVYQYHYAGRPGLSSKRKHTYIPSQFNATPDGLPGNDDSGAMGAFAAFGLLGLFPNPGQNVYLITDPFFKEINITSPATGKTATIRAVNFDPRGQNIYIQSATVNGAPYTKNWIGHELFLEGWTLELTLGPVESTTWGTQPGDLPPSTGLGMLETKVGAVGVQERDAGWMAL